MKQISIFKDKQVTNQATFKTLEELNKWFEAHEEMGTFRTKPKEVVTQSLGEESTVEVLEPTHTFLIEDVIDTTVEDEAKKVKKEQLKAAIKSVDATKLTTIKSLGSVVNQIKELLGE